MLEFAQLLIPVVGPDNHFHVFSKGLLGSEDWTSDESHKVRWDHGCQLIMAQPNFASVGLQYKSRNR